MQYKFDVMFSHFDTIPLCDRQTERQMCYHSIISELSDPLSPSVIIWVQL